MVRENAPSLVFLTLSPTKTREQYIECSKNRALTLLRVGLITEAVASMIMDQRKGPNCAVPHEIHAIGIAAAAAGNVALVRAYIEGF